MATSKKRAPTNVGKKHSLDEITGEGEDDGSGAEEATTPGVIKKPFGELGKRLPIGSLVGEGLVKDLVTRPWKTRDDREMGKERKKDTTPGRYIAMVLRRMCPQLGAYRQADFAGEGDLEKAMVKMGQVFSGDIFFAYIMVRIEALGPELPLQITCGACEHGFKFVGDLNTVECYCVEDPEDLYWEFELRAGCEIRGKNVSTFVMGPTCWNLMDEAQRVGRNGKLVDVDAIKLATARHAIYFLDGDRQNRVQLAEVELDDMSKFDQARLMDEINGHSLGPQMIIEGDCPKCKHHFQMPIDWEADSFFSISSRS